MGFHSSDLPATGACGLRVRQPSRRQRSLAWLALFARIERRAIPQLLKAPALVVTFDEWGGGGAHALSRVRERPPVPDAVRLHKVSSEV